MDYIYKLDAAKDADMLRQELPMVREACLRVLMVCTIFLKKVVEACLCLAKIGAMMSREFHGVEEEPSELEEIYMSTIGEVICKLEVMLLNLRERIIVQNFLQKRNICANNFNLKWIMKKMRIAVRLSMVGQRNLVAILAKGRFFWKQMVLTSL